MAFGERSFTEQMSPISQSNFLGGLVLKAQGDLIKSQTLATQNIISGFSKRLQELESTPISVDDQLKKLNEDPDIKDNMTSLQGMLGDYQALTLSVMDRQKMMNKIYGDTLNALAGTGGETAGRVSESLKGQYNMKSKELEELGQLPLKSAEYKQTLLNIENTRANAQTGQVKLDELRQDTEAQKLFRDMIDSDEFSGLVLGFNTASGKPSYDIHKLRDQMWLKYKDDPRGFERAWTGVDEYIRTHVEKFRPEFRTGGGDGFGKGYMDSLLKLKMLYSDLRDVAGKVGTYQNDSKYQYLRDEYSLEANGILGNPDPSKKPNELWKYNFGADPQVNAQLKGDTKEAADYVHKMMYDKTNSDSYWANIERFGVGTLQGKDGISGYMGNLRLPDPTEPSGQFTFDISKLITNSRGKPKVKGYSTHKSIESQEEMINGGWWSPYEKQVSPKESQLNILKTR